MLAWNGARLARDSKSGCGWWACTTAPVAVAARLPGRRGAVSRAADDKVSHSAAGQTHTVSPTAVYRIQCASSQTGSPDRATCTRCAGSEPVCPVSVSGVGSTGRSSSSNSSSSSGGSSF